MMRTTILAIGLTVCFATNTSAQPPQDFAGQVRQNFEAWDTDHDGKLSPNEVERAVADPKVKGNAAATAAALRRGVRAQGIKSLSLQQILNAVREPAKGTPKYEAMYKTAQERIRTAHRELFVSDQPTVECIGQGHLGDCFLLATLGTVAVNDPQRLKAMFKLLPEEKVEVSLGGRKLTLDLPTDAEICIGAQNRNDGMWAVLFEKAVGTIYLERQKTPNHVTPLSIVGVGGSPHLPLELLTGHAIKRTGCEDFQRDKLDAEARDKKLAEVRGKLTEAFRHKRLIVGGTAALGGKQTVVPGLYYNHSYGVLAFNDKTDEVTFWNPFGNRYTPKGSPGLTTGYATEHGRFTMPLTEAVMWFGSFSIESNEPAK
ncbi:C2 family cysteine protease [Limnoglobus roseus]|nr:C2 family cysteine protease [Limnoglobus roseus]